MHANAKTRGGKDHPDRDAQFRHINAAAHAALEAASRRSLSMPRSANWSGISKNSGREWEPTGRPVEVRCHDFKDKDLGHAIPYGVYDIKANEGMVSVGTVPSYCTSCSPRLGFDVA